MIWTRRFLCAVLYYTGLNAVFRLVLRRNDCVVLMYHRVVDPDDLDGLEARFVHPGMHVTTQAFEMHMDYIARHFHVIDVPQLMRAVKDGERLPRNACVITFDDGWRDNYTHAFPILKRHNLPAMVFLVSDYVGTNRWFWYERLSLMLSKCLTSPSVHEGWAAACPATERSGLFAVFADRRLPPANRIRASLAAIGAMAPSDRRTVTGELEAVLAAHHVPIEFSERVMLNWDEVAEMCGHRVGFGSHTRNHQILTEVSISEAVQEIAGSKSVIEAHLSAGCSAFCYPNGQFSNDVKHAVMAHYQCAFSTARGFVKPGDDIFALKRTGIHNEGTFTRAMFACKTSGILDLFLSVWNP